MNSVVLQRILETLQQQDNYLTFIKTTSDEQIQTEINDYRLQDDEDPEWTAATSCWNGYKYMKHLLAVNQIKITSKLESTEVDPIIKQLAEFKSGFYLCILDSCENHYFGLYSPSEGEKLCYISSYGGHYPLITKRFNRNNWLKLFTEALTGNKTAYARAFNCQRPSSKPQLYLFKWKYYC